METSVCAGTDGLDLKKEERRVFMRELKTGDGGDLCQTHLCGVNGMSAQI